MKKFIIFFALLFTLIFGNELLAQNWVGIPSDKLNYYAAEQEESNWCWAASIQMIMNYYGVAISQKQIVARSYGVSPDGELPNWPGSFEVITRNLNDWNIDSLGNSYVVQSLLYWYAPRADWLIQQLAAQRPVLLGYSTGGGQGHAVVITACSYYDTYYGPYIQTVVVRDPWPSSENQKNHGRVEYPGISLASVSMAHWYIWVSH